MVVVGGRRVDSHDVGVVGSGLVFVVIARRRRLPLLILLVVSLSGRLSRRRTHRASQPGVSTRLSSSWLLVSSICLPSCLHAPVAVTNKP